MTITPEQKQIIAEVDKKTKKLIANLATREKILVQMLEYMPAIKKIISSTDNHEMDLYCQEYTGFYSYMKILEDLARGIKTGAIPKRI